MRGGGSWYDRRRGREGESKEKGLEGLGEGESGFGRVGERGEGQSG